MAEQAKQTDHTNPLIEAMGDLAGAEHGKMEFRGKKYSTVALRVEMLRRHFNTDASIRTRIIHTDDHSVVMEARVYIKREDGWRFVANGYAEEKRGATNVNKTSALENCETSAIGRALAALGLGGGEYATADELTGAITQQNQPDDSEPPQEDPVDRMNRVLQDERVAEAVQTIKAGIADGDFDSAAKAWFGTLEDEEKKALWVAPTRGGIFTVDERAAIKTREFREAYYGKTEAA